MSSAQEEVDTRSVMFRAQCCFKPYFGKKGAHTAFRLAVQKKLKRPVPQQTFWKWVYRTKLVPPDAALAIQQATKGRVKAYELRPDAYRRHGNAK